MDDDAEADLKSVLKVARKQRSSRSVGDVPGLAEYVAAICDGTRAKGHAMTRGLYEILSKLARKRFPDAPRCATTYERWDKARRSE